jgi:hypothetical protein
VFRGTWFIVWIRALALLAAALACRDDAAGSELVVLGPPASQVDPSASRLHSEPKKVPTDSADLPSKATQQNLATPMGMTGSESERHEPSVYDGSIWLSYSDALKELKRCVDGSWYASGWRIYSGACADGKRFLTQSGAFAGSTRFYRGDQFPGRPCCDHPGSVASECKPRERTRRRAKRRTRPWMWAALDRSGSSRMVDVYRDAIASLPPAPSRSSG